MTCVEEMKHMKLIDKWSVKQFMRVIRP